MRARIFGRGLLTRIDQQTAKKQAFLDPVPPGCCIVLEKWPHHTQPWKDWLKLKRISAGEWVTARDDWVNDRTHGHPPSFTALRT